MTKERNFELHAMIDFCYWQLGKLKDTLDKPQHPLDRMIDEATGYDKTLAKEARQTAISLLKNIVEYKKEYGADYSYDEEMLNKVTDLQITL